MEEIHEKITKVFFEEFQEQFLEAPPEVIQKSFKDIIEKFRKKNFSGFPRFLGKNLKYSLSDFIKECLKIFLNKNARNFWKMGIISEKKSLGEYLKQSLQDFSKRYFVKFVEEPSPVEILSATGGIFINFLKIYF